MFTMLQARWVLVLVKVAQKATAVFIASVELGVATARILRRPILEKEGHVLPDCAIFNMGM